MDALKTLDNNGEPAALVAIPSWEELRAYRFEIYPDVLMITTNAPEEFIKTCAAKWEADFTAGVMYNLEELLRRAGYFCVTASFTDKDVQTL